MKILFRPLTRLDLPDRVRWFSDPEVSMFLGDSVRNGTTLQQQRKWFKKQKDSKGSSFFVIEVDKKPVGNIALIEINKIDKNAGVFIVIGEKEYWGCGVSQKALEYITKYGFRKLLLHKIWLQVYEPNIAAIKCYEKFGFEIEGEHTEMVRLDDEYFSEIFMGLVNPDD